MAYHTEVRGASEASTGATARLFLALWPSADLQQRLGELARSCVAEVGGRPVPGEKIHMTLAFLGDLSPARARALEQAVDCVDWPPCRLVLDRLGWWRRNGILWAGCAEVPQALATGVARLQTALEGAGFPRESRPFRPHLTLARRVRRAPRERALAPPVVWPVSGFCMVRSRLEPRGARYEILRRWSAEAMDD